MSAAVTRILIVLGTVIVLGVVNWSIYAKEQIIRTGDTIFLGLAPVDPRSLMQGDYMALQFEIARELDARRGVQRNGVWLRASIELDDRRVARLARSEKEADPFIRYRFRGNAWVGTNAYFFEEGTARRYDEARFGEFRLNRETGEAVLVGLRDGNMREL